MSIEEQFFKAFDIEPKKQGYCDWQSGCPYSDIKCGDDCPYWEYENELKYPEITDRKLLEMICILGNGKDGSKNLNLYTANKDEWFAVLKDQYNLAYCAAIDNDFKNAILKLCIYRADINDFKHQIQQLFKEGE